jgi:restriction endonuclease Mrr
MFAKNNAVDPKHVSRLVARLDRGQYGIFVTTSYFTVQAQKEVLSSNYPVKLLSGIDLIDFMKEQKIISNGILDNGWIKSVIR